MRQQRRISGLAITIMVTRSVVGAGVMSLPASLAEVAGPDAWLSVIVAWAVATYGVVAITQVMRRFPGRTLLQIIEQLMGTVMARIVGSTFFVYSVLVVAIVARSGSDQIKSALMPRTPIEVILLSLLLVAAYVVREGVEPIVRLITVLFPFVYLPLVVLTFAARDARLDNFLPFLAQGPWPVVQGAFVATFAFLGFEALFIWVAAMRDPRQATKAAVVGVAMAVLVYGGITLVTLSVFTPIQAAHLRLPLKAITDAISMPRVFLERFDVFIVTVWITAIHTTLLVHLHVSSRFLQSTVGFRTHTPLVLALVPVVYLIALLPRDTAEVERFQSYLGWPGLVLAIGFPTVLWIWLALTRKGNKVSP